MAFVKSENEIQPAAKIITDLIFCLKQNQKDEEIRKWILITLDLACRQVEKFIKPEVSERAQQYADTLGLGDLSNYHWSDQPRAMGDKGRKIFHWEHVLPVAEMKRRLLRDSNPSIAYTTKILMSSDIAWILKDENDKLNKAKLSHRREGDPWGAYKCVGIEMRNGMMS